MSPPLNADLWTHARALLAAFVGAWGQARAIAMKWRMLETDIAEALKMLAPAEALVRRLIFAHALTLKVKARPSVAPASSRQPRRCRQDAGATLIPHDPLAFWKACHPESLIHLRPRHPLEKPAEEWRVRFCVARFRAESQHDASRRTAGASPAHAGASRTTGPARAPAVRPGDRSSPPIRVRSLREMLYAQALLTPSQLREEREALLAAKPWLATPAPAPNPPQRIDTGPLARRVEALRRVIDNPLPYARALARRMAKLRATTLARVVRKWRRFEDVQCGLALQRIDPLLEAWANTS
jgi:hypothetical protein